MFDVQKYVFPFNVPFYFEYFTLYQSFFGNFVRFGTVWSEKMLSLLCFINRTFTVTDKMDGKQNLHAVHEQAFFKLVRLAIGASSDNDVELDDEGWEAVFGMSRKQTLVAVVLDGVEKLPAERRPPAGVLMPWIALVQQIEMNNRRLNRMAVKVCERFGKDGMGCVVLKGQGNAVLYPRPLHRMAGDIDLWVEGRRDAVAAYVRRYCPRSEIVYHHADFPVLKDTEIEVHFTPSWMNDFPTDRRLQKYFRENMPRQLLHTVELPEGAGRIAVPTPDMNRIYILLHIYRHLFDEGVGLRQLLDYYFVLCVPCSEEEKAQTLHMLDRLHMTRFASAVMYVLREVFGLEESRLLLPPSPLYGVRLLDEIMLAGNFGKYDGRIVRRCNETSWRKFCRKVTRNFTFLRDYPREVVWSPVFKIWHYLWRMRHGYFRKDG